jgi:hypothetical protein
VLRAKVASGRHCATIMLLAADTTLTINAVVAPSVATWDERRPPYSPSCTAPCSTGLSLHNAEHAHEVDRVGGVAGLVEDAVLPQLVSNNPRVP